MNRQITEWLDDSDNVRKVVYALGVSCAVLLSLDFVYHKHVHFDFEQWKGFYGVFGFAACIALVLAARSLRAIVKREEDYYDE